MLEAFIKVTSVLKQFKDLFVSRNFSTLREYVSSLEVNRELSEKVNFILLRGPHSWSFPIHTHYEAVMSSLDVLNFSTMT